eukprot:jgi/Botrbrau1/5527/Bobra.0023s0014.1
MLDVSLQYLEVGWAIPRPLRSYLQVRRPLRCSSINTVILSSLSNPESRDPLAKSVRPSATSVTDPATAGTNLKEFKASRRQARAAGSFRGSHWRENWSELCAVFLLSTGTKVTLVLFDEDDNVLEEVPVKARTGDVLACFCGSACPLANICYGYKVTRPQAVLCTFLYPFPRPPPKNKKHKTKQQKFKNRFWRSQRAEVLPK